MPLRPLAVGDIFAGTFAYIRASPLLTLGSAATVTAVGAAVSWSIAFAAARLPSPAFATLWPLGSAAVSVVLGSLVVGLLLVVLGRAVLGQRTDLGLAWRAVAPRLSGLIGISLLIMLIAVAAVLIIILPALLAYTTGSRQGPTWVGLSITLFWAVGPAYIYLVVLLALAPAAYVLEPIGVMAALGRSRQLVRGAWWQTFGVLALAGFAIVVPAIVVFGLSGLYTVYPFREPSVGRAVLTMIAFLVVNTFAVPFSAGVVGLLYTDRRIRRERFDVQLTQALRAG